MKDHTPERCPYCGSIETHDGFCDWCHSAINEKYFESEENSHD